MRFDRKFLGRIAISVTFQVRKELEHIIHNYENFNRNTALKCIVQFEKSEFYSNISFIEKLLLFFYKVEINEWLQRYESVVLIFDEMERFFESNDQLHDNFSELIINSFRIMRSISKNNYDDAKKIIDKTGLFLPVLLSESYYNSNSYLYKYIISFYLNCSWYYNKINENQTKVSYLKLALDKAKLLGNQYYLFLTYYALINHYLYEEDYSELKSYLTEVELAFDSLQEPFLRIWVFQNLSAENMWSGRLKHGLKYNDMVVKLLSSIKSDEESFYYLKYYSDICRGIISMFMGKYNDCQRCTLISEESARILYEKFDDPIPLSSVYGNIGELYLYLDRNLESFDYLIKGLNLRLLQTDAITHLSDSYFCLIRLFVKNNNVMEAENYLRRFESFVTKWNSEQAEYADLFNAYFSVAKATILIAKKSIKTNYEAQLLLRKIIEENRVKTEIIIDALLPLIEISIQEFKLFQNEETFNDIRNLVNNLNELVKQTSSISLKIQSLIIQGKINIILGNFNLFEQFFNEARAIAKEYDLTSVEKWIISELSNFQTELSKWQTIITSNVSIRERIELIQLEEYVKGVQHILVE